MKLLKTTAVAGLLVASSAVTAVELSGNVALTTDYVWRGVSQSDNGVAIQGGFDAGFENGLYAGVWGSNVDFGDSASLELDLYAGWAGEFSGVGVDAGIIHYAYPDENGSNFNEVYLGLSMGPVSLMHSVGFDTGSENTGDNDFGNYTDLGLDLGEVSGVAFGAHLGHYDLKDGGDDYSDWKLSASTGFIGADWELAYTDSDSDAGNLGDERVILTVSKSL